MLKVLVVDDQPAVREALELLFDLHELPVLSTADPGEALAHVRSGGVGVVVQDMNFSPGRTEGRAGIELFRQLRRADPELPVLLLTAWTSLETAVQLVKEGASDYLAKPWDDSRLVAEVQRLLAARQAALGDTHWASDSISHADLRGLVYRSQAMERLLRLALEVADSSVPVLITGPNGAGKERLAEILQANSSRRDQPFLKVNVGALPLELMEAELFGAEVGAYTGLKQRRLGRFEKAHGGTLFLDEIDSLSLSGQVKLLRALESGEFSRLGESQTRRADVRLLSATNTNLDQAINEGRLREDLYFRLNVIELRIPPLQERPEDILPLAQHFLQHFTEREGRAPANLGEEAAEALLAHHWPGNVRELRNRMQRAGLLAAGRQITAADLDLSLSRDRERQGPATRGAQRQDRGAPARDTVDDGRRNVGSYGAEHAALGAEALQERLEIEQALAGAQGVVATAASTLGISRQALYRKMERLGVVLERRTRRETPPS